MEYLKQIQHPKWQRKRLEILNRDNFTCQLCGEKEKLLDVHHLIYFSGNMIWEYDNELLITLCNDKCHKEIEELRKIIALISLQVIKRKIDLVELSEIIKEL